MSSTQKIIDVHERPALYKWIPLSLQHLLAMFGATVLVPFLTGLSPAVALFTSGFGTLIFILCTGGKVPAYLGSSFAFIGPIIAAKEQYGVPAALGGAVAAGLIYVLASALISLIGTGWIKKFFPPVLVGSVIIVIGMGLAPTAISMAGLNSDAAALSDPGILTALITLVVTIIASVFFKGFLGVIPILFGITAGYITGLLTGLVDLSPIGEAAVFAVPQFTLPKFSLPAIAAIAPVALVTMAEHIGDVLTLGGVTGKDFTAKPGLHRTLLGDGLATSFAGLLGGPPNTTYGENIGVMAITRVYSVWVTGGAAVLAILLSFFGKFEAIISSIPQPVMGGICMALFGIIAASGLRMLVSSGVDYTDKQNLLLSSVVLTLGIGGAKLNVPAFGNVIQISSMAFATLAGVILNLLFQLANRKKAKEN
ncbi:MAG: uracil permease [Bacillota bacterium]|jgi:uracil permease